MKKTKFLRQLNSVVAEAMDFIKKATTKHKKINFFIGIPKGDEDEFYDLPTITDVDKHYNYEQFGVLSIEKVGKDVILHTKGRSEDNDELRDFKLAELSNDDKGTVCEIADLISGRIK